MTWNQRTRPLIQYGLPLKSRREKAGTSEERRGTCQSIASVQTSVLLHCVLVESAVVLEEGSPSEMELKETEFPAESPESEDFETSCSEQVLSEERFSKSHESYSRVSRNKQHFYAVLQPHLQTHGISCLCLLAPFLATHWWYQNVHTVMTELCGSWETTNGAGAVNTCFMQGPRSVFLRIGTNLLIFHWKHHRLP